MRVVVPYPALFAKVLALAVLAMLPMASASAQDAIPGLDRWTSQMLTYGQRHCTNLKASQDISPIDTALLATYYDATRVYYQIGEYTGDDTTWGSCARAARYVYRDRYVIPNNATVPGYWNFTTGMRMDFARTADPKSKEWAIKLSTNAPYANDATYYSWINPNLAREIAYATMAYVNAEALGAAPRAQRAAYVNSMYGFINTWVTNGWVGTTWQVSPFMMGMVAQALIRDWETTGDSRLIPALSSLADYLWANAWETSNSAFRYQINPNCNSGDGYSTPGAGGAVDLNLIIAPLYAFLWQQTAATRFRDRGDAAFASGVAGAWLDGPKQFNQNYWWSFDYVKWRSGAATPPPTSPPPPPPPTSPPTGGTTPTTVAFAAPTDGTTVKQTVTVSATATGSASTLRLDLDGSPVVVAAGNSASYLWDTRTGPNGRRSWQARALDAAGNVVATSTVTTVVANTDTTAPTVTLNSPAGSLSRKSTVTLVANASDDVGVQRVEFYVNGTLYCSNTSAPYSCTWRIPAAGNRDYTLEAKAYDAAGNVGASGRVTVSPE